MQISLERKLRNNMKMISKVQIIKRIRNIIHNLFKKSNLKFMKKKKILMVLLIDLIEIKINFRKNEKNYFSK